MEDGVDGAVAAAGIVGGEANQLDESPGFTTSAQAGTSQFDHKSVKLRAVHAEVGK